MTSALYTVCSGLDCDEKKTAIEFLRGISAHETMHMQKKTAAEGVVLLEAHRRETKTRCSMCSRLFCAGG